MKSFRGTIIHTPNCNHIDEADRKFEWLEDGILVFDNEGEIVFVGEFKNCPEDYKSESHINFKGILVPGFVDTHIHFPQTLNIHGFSGGNLIKWLDTVIFPSESNLSDVNYAKFLAEEFINRRISAGTTLAMVCGSAFDIAQDELFAKTISSGLRMICGRGIQTQGPVTAQKLITSENDAISKTEDEINKWHGKGSFENQIAVAIFPRFALSVTVETLKNLGELYDNYRPKGVYFHTHISESKNDEITNVLSTYQTDSYLDVYDGKFLPNGKIGGKSLLGKRSIFAHAVHCTDQEYIRLKDTGSSISHCPSSQQFLGSGTMPLNKVSSLGVKFGLGSDIGAGDYWTMTQVANSAYKSHINSSDPISLTPAQMLYLMTLAGAQALNYEHIVGDFIKGKSADFVIINPDKDLMLSKRLGLYDDKDQFLFDLLLSVNELHIDKVFVNGQELESNRF